MKHIPLILIFIGLSSNCKSERGIGMKDRATPIASFSDCNPGKMERIEINPGTIEKAPSVRLQKDSLLIVVDPAFKTVDFISADELFFRQESKVATIGEHSLSSFIRDQKEEDQAKEFEKQKNISGHLADSIHFENNKGQQEIWILNKSKQDMVIPCSDGMPVAVLQGLDKHGKWQPVNYYWFNWCGNSYSYLSFKPGEALRFITNIPNEGNFKTKFRFKLLGNKTFHYSNTFDGVIDYCQFSDRNINTDCINCKPTPQNKLEVLPNGW